MAVSSPRRPSPSRRRQIASSSFAPFHMARISATSRSRGGNDAVDDGDLAESESVATFFDDRSEQVGLGREVVVERGHVHVTRVGELPHGGRRRAVLGHQVERGVEDVFTPAGRRRVDEGACRVARHDQWATGHPAGSSWSARTRVDAPRRSGTPSGTVMSGSRRNSCWNTTWSSVRARLDPRQ